MMKVKSVLYGFVCGSLLSGITAMMVSSVSGKERQEIIKRGINNVKSPLLELKESTVSIGHSLKNVQKQASVTIPSIVTSVGESLEQFQKDTEVNQENLQQHLEEIHRLTSTPQ